mgnify:FL=1|jgi:small-conductance mechanosensitive channel
MKPLQRWQNWHTHLPDWLQEWLDVMVPLLQIVLIVFCAWLLHRLVRRVLSRASTHYQLPHELLMPINVVVRWLIVSGAVLLALERLGVSATVLWSAFTGFATVGAVAFFAAWSVLSNLFCAFLIFTGRPFVVGDTIELLDNAEKPGALGKVVDINLLYTTLEDISEANVGAQVQIPNALIFQRVLRRWRAGSEVPAGKTHNPASSAPAPAAEKAPKAAQPT